MSRDEVYENWNPSPFNTGLVFSTSAAVCGVLPKKFLYAASDLLMDWYQGWKPETLASVRRNLAGLFPSYSRGRLQTLAESTFTSYGRGVVDYLRSSIDPPIVVPTKGDLSHLKPDENGARILVTAHMGNWEIGGAYIGELIGPHWIVGFPERSGEVESFRRGKREETGNMTMSAGGGLASMFRMRKALESGTNLIFLVDRAVGGDGVKVTLRGHPTRFLKSPALLSALSGCPIVPVAITRRGNGSYAARAGSPVFTESGDDAGKTMQKAADFFGEIMESYPDQWYNFFEYWREEP